MMQGYFDDSGSEPKSFTFVLAGYMLPSEQMIAFSEDWKTALSERPKIQLFKMHDAFHGDREFQCWGSEFRKAKVRDLLSVIHKHRPVGLTSFMNWEHFKFFSRYLPEPLNREAFAPLFFQLIDNMLLYQQSAKTFPQKVQMDFDDQSSAGKFAINWYGELMDGHSPFTFSPAHRAVMEGTPRMLTDNQHVALQAADMAAWFVRNAGTPGIETADWHWAYEDCMKTIWPHCRGFGEQTFEQLLDVLIGPRLVTLG
jgi:hypothetical protein